VTHGGSLTFLTRRTSLVAVLSVLAVSACGLVPSDPPEVALGVSLDGAKVVAWVPNCQSAMLQKAQIYDASTAFSGTPKPTWTAGFVPNSTPERSQVLSQSNTSLTDVSGDYAGVAQIEIDVLSGSVWYVATVSRSDLNADTISFRGNSISRSDWPAASAKECAAH
jgi:hypothetical protein